MNSRDLRKCWLCGVISLFHFARVMLLAAPVPDSNHVLDLDGAGDWVRLPPAGFTNFHQATIEAWVKFRAYNTWARVFDFGARGREIYVGTTLGSAAPNSAAVKFLVVDAAGARRREDVYGGFRLNEWTHVAVVTGPGGVRLYLNGSSWPRTILRAAFLPRAAKITSSAAITSLRTGPTRSMVSWTKCGCGASCARRRKFARTCSGG